MTAFAELHGHSGWVCMWQSVHAASTVVGLKVWPELLASLIQPLPGVVFWLLSMRMSKVNARTKRSESNREKIEKSTTFSYNMFTLS